MVSRNNAFLCVSVLGTFVAVCYGSISDMRPLRHNNDEIDSTEIGMKFRRDGRSYANEFGNTTGFITRNGSLDFDFNNETHAADVDSLYLLKNAKLQRLEPLVQCTDDAMTVRMNIERTPRFLVDDGEGFLIPWTRMPSHCGFSVTRSHRDVLFVAPYKGCHVTEKGGKHVLRLRLWGEHATMSCPVLPSPLSVTCFAYGMLLNMGNITADAIRVKVYDAWKPVLSSGELCGFAMVSHLSETMITAPYKEPCFKIKDEKHVLVLNANGQEVSVSCPSQTSPVDPLLPSATTATPTTGASSESQSPELLSFPGHQQFPRSPPFPGSYLMTDTPRAARTELPQYSEFIRTHPTTTSTRAGPADPQFTMSPEFPGFLQFLGSPEFHRSTEHIGSPQHPGLLQIPRSIEYPEFPGSAEYPGSLEFLGSAEYPGSLEFPESTEYPGSSEFPGFLQLDWFPQFPGFSQFPGSPEIPEYHEFSQFPVSTELPEYPGFSQFPGSPEIPEFLQYPGFTRHIPWFTNTRAVPADPQIRGFRQFPGSFLAAAKDVPKIPELSSYPGFPIHTSEASGWRKAAALYNPWKQKGKPHIVPSSVMYQDDPSSQSSVTRTQSGTPRSSTTAGVED